MMEERANQTIAMEPAPLIFCGVASGGTTYLLKLLNAISCVHLSFEGRMLREGLDRFATLGTTTRAEFLKALDDLCTGESEIGKNTILVDVVRANQDHLYAVWQARRSYMEMMSEVYRLAYGKPVWGDKMLRIEYAWDFLKHAPDTKFIVLYRDPRAVAASIDKKFTGRSPYAQTCGYWNTHFALGQKLLAERPGQTLVVRYEDLMDSTVETVRRIISFVNPKLVHEAESIVQKLPADATRNAQWKRLPAADIKEIEEICYTGMTRLGYAPEHASQQRRQSRLGYLWVNLRYYRRVLLKPSLIRRKQLFKRLRLMLQNINPE